MSYRRLSPRRSRVTGTPFCVPEQADMVMGVGSQWAIDATGLVGDTSTFHAVHMNHSRRRANVVRYTGGWRDRR